MRRKKSHTVATAQCPECGYEGRLDLDDLSFSYEYWGAKGTFHDHAWVCPECNTVIAEDLIGFDEIEPDYDEMRGE